MTIIILLSLKVKFLRPFSTTLDQARHTYFTMTCLDQWASEQHPKNKQTSRGHHAVFSKTFNTHGIHAFISNYLDNRFFYSYNKFLCLKKNKLNFWWFHVRWEKKENLICSQSIFEHEIVTHVIFELLFIRQQNLSKLWNIDTRYRNLNIYFQSIFIVC